MREVYVRDSRSIPLGRLGEHEATVIIFDVTNWRGQFGDGVFNLLHQRSIDAAPYACVVEQSGKEVRWEITGTDVSASGHGRCELIYIAGDRVAKSEIYTTVVGEALAGAEETPEPWQDWVQRVLESGARAAASAEAAARSATAAMGSAEAAERRAENAAGSAADAGAAQTAAEAARTAAETAQSAAEAAQVAARESASAAAGSARDALGYAGAAVVRATEAAGWADDAKAAKNAATGSATAAASSASAAATSATAAASSASAAATSADAAQNAKDAAIEALEAFHAPTATAQTLRHGTPATASYDGQNFDFGIPQGEDGKSAYQSAQDGGYTGTEQQFNSDLAGVGGKIASSEKGAAGGVASLGADGKVPTAQLPTLGFTPRIVVTAPTGSTVTCAKGSTVLTASEVSGTWTFDVPDYGTWTVNAVKGGESASDTVGVTEVKQYNVSLAYTRIYGVSWAGNSATTLTRTDAAAGFADPVPALSNGSGSSPFDSCMPWSGMVKENRTGGVMVKIPKFWYKLTQNGNGVKIQIADGPVEGFSVSPAHMNRGDGKGERDYVYIGRYHCASDYKSKTGVKPVTSITRSSARSSIHNLGTNIWQCDFAMRFTIWLLYIVEFADWDSQTKIGYGCGNNSATENMGYTDSMQYHTGTTLSGRTTYGVSTQYRWIEGLWDNVYDWCDGCYYNSNGLNIILNPSSFSDSSGGTLAGSLTGGYPSALSVKSVSGIFPVFVPSASSGSNTTYVPDYWLFDASIPCLFVGGNYNQVLGHGMFFVYCFGGTSYSYANIGCRLQELP